MISLEKQGSGKFGHHPPPKSLQRALHRRIRDCSQRVAMNTCLPIRRLFSFSRQSSPPDSEIKAATNAPLEGHVPPITYTYMTTCGGSELKFDLYLPHRVVKKRSRLLRKEKSLEPEPLDGDNSKFPVVIYFGNEDRRGVALKGFIDDVVKTKHWAFIVADHAPATTGHDTLSSMHALFRFLHSTLADKHPLSTTNVFVAGYLKGGYVALLAGIHMEPKPLAVFLVSASGGHLLSSRYLDQIDAITGIGGLSSKLRVTAEEDKWEEMVPEEARCLFPELLVDESFPPTFIAYGCGKKEEEEESVGIAQKLKGRKVPTELVVTEVWEQPQSTQLLHGSRPGTADPKLVQTSGDAYTDSMKGVLQFFEERIVPEEEDELDEFDVL